MYTLGDPGHFCVMSDSTILSIRIDRAVKARLESLSKATKRSKSSLAAEGIATFVEIEERQIEGIKRAMASLDRGDGVPHDEVESWIASWDTEGEEPLPEAPGAPGAK